MTDRPPPPAPSSAPPLGALRDAEVEPGVRATASCDIPGTLPFFATHTPRSPVLPGVLLLDSAAQVAALAAPFAPLGWRVGELSRARWRAPVRAGDRVTVTAEVDGPAAGDGLSFRITVLAGDRAVADVRRLTLVRRTPDRARTEHETR